MEQTSGHCRPGPARVPSKPHDARHAPTVLLTLYCRLRDGFYTTHSFMGACRPISNAYSSGQTDSRGELRYQLETDPPNVSSDATSLAHFRRGQ
ncbi:hypothetical protein BP1026B_II0467 [Burkholderia pseudomallei 1026b]|uniref:Uncharacterized protein n=1 Tax=Burkholderia pseudomallei (strain 1026b) TaxID=884204 RepID=A0A0H3HR63_BURP2|nr:hypothetical protein BP1026B_II0467 [Burkholderia pseudomallei 1026b]EIF61979.1 hypothetical protein BP1026A_2151 [Burkholderia pseudomallei 1026a]